MSNPISPDDVLVYGQIALDNVIRLPALPGPQAAVAVNADYYIVGGAALMTALPLAEWGHPVRVVGNAVGEDPYADFIRSELERYPTLSGAGITTDPRVRTPFTRRLIAPDGQTLSLAYWQERSPLPPLTEDDLAGVRLLSLNGPGEAAQVAAATLAVEQGIPVITSDIADPEDPLVPLSTWIVVSQKWLQRAQSMEQGSERDFLQRVHAHNPAATLVMTRGPETTRRLAPGGVL